MMLFMILFWVCVIVRVVLVVLGIRRLSRQHGDRPRSGEAPLEILRRRHAAGEIDQEEFEKRRRSLADSTEGQYRR